MSMTRRYFILFIFPVLVSCSSSQLPEKNPEYAVLSQLLSLKSDHSVVQNYDARLEINSEDHAIYHLRTVTTVMNTDARDAGRMVLPYGGFQEIRSVNGGLYSRDGRLIRKLENNDATDIAITGNYNLYDDTRLKIFELYHNEYPYTVVYDYEIELSGLLNLPDFLPQDRNQYVEQAQLKVTIPEDLKLNYHILNSNTEVTEILDDGDSVLVWEMNELKPIEKEPLGQSYLEKVPRILLAVESFKIAESRGKLDSWDSFGQWYYSLSKGRNKLPESVKQEVRSIYNNADNRQEGIRALYEYMQDKTRYVSIQLGIGGWQPFEAGYVEERRYGDCKALTNYMQAILEYAGVESYPVLVRNGIGEPEIITEFPSQQFNHVILWVPGKDTVWLESTSQSLPYNYIGYSNSNRYGLAVTPDSSFLIKTPTYDHQKNTLDNRTVIHLDSNGNAKIDIQSTYSGYYLDELLGGVAQKSDSERQRWIYKQFTLNSFQLRQTDFSDVDSRKKSPELHFEIYNPGYATRTGSRLFIPVNKLNRWDYEFPDLDKERKEKIDFGYRFREEDQSVIRVPNGFDIEAIPSSIELDTDFASYNLQINTGEGDWIEIVRVLEVSRKVLSADKYDELLSFFAEVRSNDQKNIVFKIP